MLQTLGAGRLKPWLGVLTSLDQGARERGCGGRLANSKQLSLLPPFPPAMMGATRPPAGCPALPPSPGTTALEPSPLGWLSRQVS